MTPTGAEYVYKDGDNEIYYKRVGIVPYFWVNADTWLPVRSDSQAWPKAVKIK